MFRFIVLSCLLTAVSAQAQTNTPVSTRQVRPITLEEAIRDALQHNLDIQISRYTPEIANFNLAGSYAVYEPSLNLSADRDFNTSPGGQDQQGLTLPSNEVESDTFGGSLGPGLSGYLPTGLQYQLDATVGRREFTPPGREQFSSGTGIRLNQPLLRDFWIDQPRYQILINKKNIKQSEFALRGQIIDILARTEQAYYNLIFARESVRVQNAALELANRTLRDNRIRVEVGALAVLEEAQAESEVASSVALLIEAERAVSAQQNLLKSLLTDDFASIAAIDLDPVEKLVAIPPTSDLAESWRRGLTLRPDLQQLKIDLEKRDITLKFYKNQLLPALDLRGSYGFNGLDSSYSRAIEDVQDRNNPRYSYGVVLSIPLGNRAARSTYNRVTAEKQQALLQYKKLEQDVLISIDDAVKLIQTSYQRVEATRRARAFAQQALDSEQKKFEAGKSTSFFVLQFQRSLTQSRFDEIRALADYNNALAQLASREGTTLQRHQINPNVR